MSMIPQAEDIEEIWKTPEERMWFRVFEFAIRDALHPKPKTQGKTEEKIQTLLKRWNDRRARAKKWINSNARDMYSCRWICEVCEISYLDDLRSIINGPGELARRRLLNKIHAKGAQYYE